MKKILILSHEASLTGAPIFLLRLVQFLDTSKEYKFFILFNNAGDLLQDFQIYSNTMVLSNLNHNKNRVVKLLIRFLPMYKLRNMLFLLRIRFFQPDIVISNTFSNSVLTPFIKHDKLKVITIVHEMKHYLRQAEKLKIFDVSKPITASSHFIAVSNSVKQNLLIEFKIRESDISLIYNNNSYFMPQKIAKSEMIKWRKENNIPENTFIVGSCGSLIWRKGPDIFLSILKRFKKKFPDQKIFFVWQGGDEKSNFFIDIENEINQLSVAQYISVLPFSKNIHFFYNAIDVYISTSREEPFGLTLLEAGSYEKPCIAFEKSGGPEEILSKNRGLLIPYGDNDKAADAIFDLIHNKTNSKKLSAAINKFVLENNSKNTFSKYKKLIDSFIK